MSFEGYEEGEIEAARAAARLENGIILHPALKWAEKRLRMHQARSLILDGQEPQPGHLQIVTGEAGAGKTTLLKIHQRRFPSYRNEDGVVMPVVRVEMPSPCTRKGLVEAILGALGHSASEDWRTIQIVEEIANLAERHHVRMIMLDEADRIFGAETKEVARFLVSLLNKVKVQFVLSGAPEIQNLHRGYGLERRKEADIWLRPYRWDTSEGQRDFRSLLKVFDYRLELGELVGLDQFDLARRIYVATGGHVGLVSKLLVATLRSSLEQECQFDRLMLGKVYSSFQKQADDGPMIDFDRDVLRNPVEEIGLDPSANPFLCTPKELRDIWEEKVQSPNSAYAERGSRKIGGKLKKARE